MALLYCVFPFHIQAWWGGVGEVTFMSLLYGVFHFPYTGLVDIKVERTVVHNLYLSAYVIINKLSRTTV